MATVLIRHSFSHKTINCKSQVIVPNFLTRSLPIFSGTATTCSLSEMSIPAACSFINGNETMFGFSVFFDVFLIITLLFKLKIIKGSEPGSLKSLIFYRTSNGQFETQLADRTTLSFGVNIH